MKKNTILTLTLLSSICFSIIFTQTHEDKSKTKYYSLSKAPKLPPSLEAAVALIEPSGNNFLDAEESGTITATVTNSGKGEAKDISFNISPRSISGLNFAYNHEIGDLEPGKNKKIQIPISADFDVKSQSVQLEFLFKEKNDFEPDGIKFTFNTKAFVPPELIVVDGLNIDDPEGEGIVKTGVVVAITAAIQNIGQGKAKNVTVKLKKGRNVNWGELNHDFSLGTLNPGDMKEFTFDVFANKKATEIPIFVSISESYGKFGSEEIRLPLEFKKKVSKIREVALEGIESGNINITHAKGYDIDIEKNIPKTGMVNKDAIAVVIGNREYESGIPMVDFAVRDAEFVKKYLIQTLGYREGNIIHKKNATLSNIKVAFNKLKGYVKKGKSDIFVYYSGHGAPDPETNQGYLVPVDADPNFIADSGYPVNELYRLLNDVNAKSLTVVIDACFSGSSDAGMILKDISPVFIEVDQSSLRGENATLFTSATGEQVSSWYREKKHSLFTYYFLKALQGEGDENKDDKLTFAEIQSYIDDNVPYMARRLNNREQTPQLDTMDKNRVLVQY